MYEHCTHSRFELPIISTKSAKCINVLYKCRQLHCINVDCNNFAKYGISWKERRRKSSSFPTSHSVILTLCSCVFVTIMFLTKVLSLTLVLVLVFADYSIGINYRRSDIRKVRLKVGFLVPAESAKVASDLYRARVDAFNARTSVSMSIPVSDLSSNKPEFVLEPIFGYVSRNDSFLGTKSG